MCRTYIVTCVHPLRVAVLLCTSLYSITQSTVGLSLSLLQAQGVWKQEGRQYWIHPGTGTWAGSSNAARHVSGIAPCPLTPVADDPSALPPPSFPFSSSSWLFAWCQPWHMPVVLLYCKIKNVYLLFLLFLYILFVCFLCLFFFLIYCLRIGCLNCLFTSI